MSKYLGAGQYFERLPGGSTPVQGVATATLMVPGYFTDGPDSGVPVAVNSWAEFDRNYGGLNTTSENGYAIKGFFDNGGQTVLPLRITSVGARQADSTAMTGWTIKAVNKGTKYNGYTVILVANADTSAHFDVTIKDASGNVADKYENVTFESGETTTANYVANLLNPACQIVNITGTGSAVAAVYTLANGNDGAAIGLTEIQAALVVGASRFDACVDSNYLLIAPDATDAATTSALITYAEGRRDVFVPYSPTLVTSTVAAAVAFRKTVTNSQKSACYWPFVKVYDLLQGRTKTMSPIGHIAGIYARTDANKNVGKNPAGIIDGAIRGITGLSFTPTMATNTTPGDVGTLYVNRVNPLVSDSAHGTCVWGCRTTSLDPQWIYVNHERLFQFVEKKVGNGSMWVNFENNTADLQLKVFTQMYSLFLGWHNEKYFAGKTPAESFFIVCDGSNNTEDSEGDGELIIDYGIAPSKPAEFIRHRLRQKTLK